MEAEQILAAILDGRAELPWQPAVRESLARALPRVLERDLVEGSAASRERWGRLNVTLWHQVRDELRDEPRAEQRMLARAVIGAAELLGVDLDGSEKFRWSLQARERNEPRIYALVAHAAPARVLMTRTASSRPLVSIDPIEEDVRARCRRLLERIAPGDPPAWALVPESSGGSKAIALIARALVERWPAAFSGVDDLALTGALDDEGNVLPVDGLQSKVDKLAAAHTGVACFVPESQVSGVQAGWRCKIIGVRSVEHLLAIFGVTVATIPSTVWLESVRARARTVLDWRGFMRSANDLIDLHLRASAPGETARYRRSVQLDELVENERRSARAGGVHGIHLIGKPGSGKSMVLRRLHHRLLEGDLRYFGPSLLLDARTLERDEALHDIDQARKLGCILLIDGADELGEPERRRLSARLAQWNGPWLVSSRPLSLSWPAEQVVELAPIESYELGSLLELEGKAELSKPLKELVETRTGAKPLDRLLTDLASTPLGVSLIAVLATSDALPSGTRQDLLWEAITHLLRRSEANARLHARQRRSFERSGGIYAGAAALHMLIEGRAVLWPDDLRWASAEVPLAHEERDQIEEMLEASGFLQRTGAAELSFSHKSIAEYLGARFLWAMRTERPEHAYIDALLPRVGEPGADEVFCHWAALEPDATWIVRALIEHPEKPMSALALATRVLAEAQVVDLLSVASVVARRLRLATQVMARELPGGLGELDDLGVAMTRFAPTLRERLSDLQAACHEDTRAWWSLPSPPEIERVRQQWFDGGAREPIAWRRHVAELLHRALDFDVPTRQLLRFEHSVDLFLTREPSRHAEVVPFLDDPDPRIASAARQVFAKRASDEELLRMVPRLSRHAGEERAAVLAALARRGTSLQQREALLRAATSAVRFRTFDDEGDPMRPGLLSGLESLSGDALLALWPHAWATGLLGVEADREMEPALERLYAAFLYDDHPLARRRAIIARRNLEKGLPRPNGRHETLLSLLAESYPQVHGVRAEMYRSLRLELLDWLAEDRAQVSIETLRASLVTLDDHERAVALWCAHRAGGRFSSEALLTLLAPAIEAPAAPHSEWRESALAPWREAIQRHAESARYALLSDSRRAIASDFSTLLGALDRPRLAATAERMLQELGSDSVHFLLEAFRRGGSGVRRWAGQKLSWPLRQEPILLAQLLEDSDVELVAIAREANARSLTLRDFEHAKKIPRRSFSNTNMLGYGAFDAAGEDAELVEPLRPEELLYLERFEDAWRLLGERPLAWRSYKDQDGFHSGEGVDFMDYLAEQAAAENAEAARPILRHLQKLFEPHHRSQVIGALGDPMRGQWAEWLLTAATPGRDLLAAFRDGETAALRAANVAIRWGLRAETTEALIAAARDGLLPFPKEVGSQFYPSIPMWAERIEKIDGIEGIARLLLEPFPDVMIGVMLPYVAKDVSRLGAESAPAKRLAQWIREQIDARSIEDQTAMLRILGVIGSPFDAAIWAVRVAERALPAPVASAAIGLLATLGNAKHLPLLMRLTLSDSPDTARAAIAAVGSFGGEAQAAQLFEHLRSTRDAESAWWDAAPVVASIGSGEQVRALAAFLLSGDGRDEGGGYGASRAAEDAAVAVAHMAIARGRHPEHALFALATFPEGQSYVVPAGVTGAGDEVYDPDTPDYAAQLVEVMTERVCAEPLRRVFLDFALTFSSSSAFEWVERLGDIQPQDAPSILSRLESSPDDPLALDCLRRSRNGERELAEIWRRNGWW